MLGALVRVGTRDGVRLEYVQAWVSRDDNVLLNAGNDFFVSTVDNVNVCIGGWCCNEFSMQSVDASCPYVAIKTEVTARKAHATQGTKRQCMASCNIQVFLPDATVEYVWVIPFRSEDANRRRMAIAPYPQRGFKVENCCGTVTGLFDVDFREIKRITQFAAARPRGCAVISTLGGTLTLCPNRYQVAFRGTRSLRLLGEDFFGLTGERLNDGNVKAYMMVLKGCLGVPVVTTSADCYIANRMRPWCAEVRWHNDVGEMVELRGIRWASLFAAAPPMLCMGKTSACITRRGGVMLRFAFPTNTLWTLAAETAVIAAAGLLMEKLSAAIRGKRLD
jgi:hypothetical protein